MTTKKTQQWLRKMPGLVGGITFHLCLEIPFFSQCLSPEQHVLSKCSLKEEMDAILSDQNRMLQEFSLCQPFFSFYFIPLSSTRCSFFFLRTFCLQGATAFRPKWMSELSQSFLLVLKMQISKPCHSTSNSALPGTVFLTCKCSQREKHKHIPFPKEHLCFIGDTWRWYLICLS